MVLLEAMSCGTPVVGSEIAAIAEVVEHGPDRPARARRRPDRLAAAAARGGHPAGRAGPAARAAVLMTYDQTGRGPASAPSSSQRAHAGRAGMSGPLRRTARVGGAGAHDSSAPRAARICCCCWGPLRASRRRRLQRPRAMRSRLAVVIPAHDEETPDRGGGRSVHAADYPTEQRAGRRRRRQLHRSDRRRRPRRLARRCGNGRTRIEPRQGSRARVGVRAAAARTTRCEGVCVVDADCAVSRICSRRSRRGCGAAPMRSRRRTWSPTRTRPPRAALRWAGFALLQRRSAARAGAARTLERALGTGMAISRRAARPVTLAVVLVRRGP